SSVDGALTYEERSGALGGETDRALMGILRALSDVVLVGAGTVRAEGYGGLSLTDTNLDLRRELGLSPLPRIAIVTRSAAIDPKSSVFEERALEERPIVLLPE